jgi:colicin import membrane protein
MVREHENPQAVKAAFLALLVHAVFFLVLVLSFDWKSEMPLQVSDVQLWDSLPPPKTQPLPPPEPEPPKPEVKPEPKPEPPPPPEPEPKAEIAVKKPEPKPEPKPEKKEPPKPDPAELKKKEEALKKKAEEKRQKELLRKLQQMDDPLAEKALNEDLKHLEAARNAEQAQRAAAASSDIVGEYVAKIQQKIRGLMNRQACGDKEVAYSISILPTGQVAGMPKLTRSSGVPACDDAALRAIMQAQPLPLPPNPELFSRFRDLNIVSKPEQ